MQTSSPQLLRNKISDKRNFDFLTKFEAKFFSLTIIWTALKNFPNFSCLLGRLEKNSLSGKVDVNEREYEKAQEIHTLMRCKNFDDYHDFFDSRCLSFSRYL